MPLPGGLTLITVTGTYTSASGSPATGSISFTPTSAVVDASGQVIIPQAPVTAVLGNGSFSIALPCTDNSGLTPSSWAYIIQVAVIGIAGTQSQFQVLLPHTLGTTVDITALTPTPGVFPVFASAFGTNNTWTGSNTFTQGLTAADFSPTGLTGAVAASRYAGATVSGSPASGTFAVGDFVIDHAGTIWVCTGAGTHGTWAALAPLSQDAARIQPVGTAASGGSTGTAADAGHVHAGLSPVAATGVSGYSLINGTGAVPGLSWTAPADGQQHPVTIFSSLDVTSAETGGQVNVTWTYPNGDGDAAVLAAGGQAAGNNSVNPISKIIRAGSTVSVVQSSALTAGAATLWAEIWGL